MNTLNDFLNTYETADAATYGKTFAAIATARTKFANNYKQALEAFNKGETQNKIIDDIENIGCYAVKLKYGTRNLRVNDVDCIIKNVAKESIGNCIEGLHALAVNGQLDDALKVAVDEIAAQRK